MQGTVEQQLQRKVAFVQELKTLPIAIQTAAANEQHYEVRRWPCCLAHPPPRHSKLSMLAEGTLISHVVPTSNMPATRPRC